MNKFLSTILLFFAVSLQAGDIITATVVVSDASQLTGANGASITIDSDTRIWTNSVVNPATQIRASTTTATAAERLLLHLSAYPFDGVSLQSTNNGVVLIGAEDVALDITISNAWATVAYRTNTFVSTNGTVVRVPYSIEDSDQQEYIANELAAWLSQATDPLAVGSLTVNDDAYGAGWNGSTNVPTKNAIYDKIETLVGGGLTSSDLDTSAEIAAIVGDETGSGALVFGTSPNLTTPTLGAATATTLDTGQGANELYDMDQNVTQASDVTFNSVTVATEAYDATGWNGDNSVPTKDALRDKFESLGTGVSTTDIDTSAEIAAIVGDETGSGALVFGTSPTLTTPTLGVATATSVEVGAEAYDATNWDDDNTVPTKNDVRDKIESMLAGGGLGTADIDTSAELRGIVGDETGTGALVFAGGDIGAATATTPSADDNDTSVATTAFVQGEISGDVRVYEFALSDETTALTTGNGKVTWRAPHAMTITAVRASVTTAPTGSTLVVDINDSGTTILSTKLSIDASEKTSTTAASAAVISDSAIADDAEVTFDIDQIGSTIAGAGLKVKIFYTK